MLVPTVKLYPLHLQAKYFSPLAVSSSTRFQATSRLTDPLDYRLKPRQNYNALLVFLSEPGTCRQILLTVAPCYETRVIHI